jgi:hypothetical protein
VIVTSLKIFQTGLCPGLEVSVLKIQGQDLCFKTKTESRLLTKDLESKTKTFGKGLETKSKTFTN